MQLGRGNLIGSAALAVLLWGFATSSTLAQAIDPGRFSAQEEAHVVLRGESLSQIAIDHGIDLETLRRLNGLTDADAIRMGVTLTLATVGERSGGLSIEDVLVLPELVGRNDVVRNERAEGEAEIQQEMGYEELNGRAVSEDSRTEEVSSAEIIPEIIHVVKRGEHLGILAKQYGVSVNAIIEANDLENANIIVVGQHLAIPSSLPIEAESTEMGNGYDVEEPLEDAAPLVLRQHEELPEALTEQDEKWIDVDLSEQRVVAYEGMQPVNSFIVSTGLPGTPTVQGDFRIWAKTPLQDMSGGNRATGDYYYLEDVPWVQYFYEEYALHGTNWHANFGQPMSRGCVNMRVEDAKWLFEWAGPPMETDATGWLFSSAEEPGTLVVVHE